MYEIKRHRNRDIIKIQASRMNRWLVIFVYISTLLLHNCSVSMTGFNLRNSWYHVEGHSLPVVFRQRRPLDCERLMKTKISS